MKTTIEIKGYMIEVEEKDGDIFVKALSGDEVIEEFEINLEGVRFESFSSKVDSICLLMMWSSQ